MLGSRRRRYRLWLKVDISFICLPTSHPATNRLHVANACDLDCKTDVVFNTLSLLFPLIGHQFALWWLDPVGAALLSLFIIYDWADTCYQNVARLTGSAVDERVLQKVTFLAWRFAPVVSKLLSNNHSLARSPPPRVST